MLLAVQILAVVGVGLVIYAIFGVFTPAPGAKVTRAKKNENQAFPPQEDTGREQKIQRLQNQVAKLEDELNKAKAQCEQDKTGFTVAQEKEIKFTEELKRREEWVARAEAELAKIKLENSDLSNKFSAKEKELEDEFTKNVNLSRQQRELKTSLEAKEEECKLKEDQLQAQKHQIEKLFQEIEGHKSAILEFNKKEKINEWVPKQEFNKLNEEYTKLEKDFEANQERLKSFAVEIAHLRKSQELAQKKPEEPKPVEQKLEEQKLEEQKPEEQKPEGKGDEGIAL